MALPRRQDWSAKGYELAILLYFHPTGCQAMPFLVRRGSPPPKITPEFLATLEIETKLEPPEEAVWLGPFDTDELPVL